MRKDIIIIDDDRDLCTLLQESLLQENICADISCNGFDGIKSVKDKEYQLVVLDVMMPGISGFEVLERIRDMSNVPILMLSHNPKRSVSKEGFVTTKQLLRGISILVKGKGLSSRHFLGGYNGVIAT